MAEVLDTFAAYERERERERERESADTVAYWEYETVVLLII